MAIEYKSDNLESALAKACPAGVDLYFDDTGGAISDIVLRRLCSGRHLPDRFGLKLESPAQLSARGASSAGQARTMQEFVIFDYAPRFEEAVARLAQWIRDARLLRKRTE